MCGDNGGADRRPVESTAGIAHREGPIAGPGRGQVLRISFIALSTSTAAVVCDLGRVALVRGGHRGIFGVCEDSRMAAVAAAHSVDPDRWWTGFGGDGPDRPRFTRHEPWRHAAALMLGMVSGLDRKNCWSIAEHRGAKTPDALQHLLSRAVWDAELVRDDLRDYVIDTFGDPGAVLVVDETGDLKKGTQSVGVQRQYTGTAGRIENSQVAVYLTYAAPPGTL